MTGSLELKNSYDAMYDAALPSVSTGRVTVDPLLDDQTDQRRGLSLIFRPDRQISENIFGFLSRLKDVEPHIYCQPLSDLHVTVMSIISCREGFSYRKLDLDRYSNRIAASLCDIKPFEVHFRGLSLSKEAVIVSGFPTDNSLERIRENLRNHFSSDEIFHTLDIRYKTVLSHMTAVRFRAPIVQTELFSRVLDDYQRFDFGRVRVGEIQFIETDWYARSKNIIDLKMFRL